MATQPINILQQVATYSDPMLAYFINLCPFVSSTNHSYKAFNDRPMNLGSTINLELPMRATYDVGLVASFQPAVERLVPLTCDQALNSSMAFNTQDFIFNAREFMEKFGKARANILANIVEKTVAQNCNSSVPVMTVDSNGQSVPTGALHVESGPYRFYNAINGLTSFQQLADICYQFRTYGAAPGELDVYLDDRSPVQIVGSGLGQFVNDRNEKLANSWDLGTYKGSNARYYSSNQLPQQIAGTLGNNNTVLTLTDWNDHSGQNVTTLTFSGAGTDSNAVKSGDLGYFLPSTGLNVLNFASYVPTVLPVQVRAVANAASSGGNITVTITAGSNGIGLNWAGGQNQNLNQALQSGMQFQFLPSHRCGMIVGGKGFFLAMPPLPDEDPYKTSVVTDKEIGVSMRMYYGSRFGQNFRGLVNDVLFAALAIPENTMRICLPLI